MKTKPVATWFGALALAFAAGCGSPDASSCGCNAGFHCPEGSSECVADDSGDMAGVPSPDLLPPPLCNPPCGGGTPHCNAEHRCVSCLADADCPKGTYCNDNGSCAAGCKDDARCRLGGAADSNMCCTMSCTDTSVDPSNCGACGMACTAVHAGTSCVGGKCMSGACESGWGDCNGNAADGCETSLHVDTRNCTMCGMACNIANGLAGCSDGCYIRACNFGWDDCDGDIANGCEVSVLKDAMNCGACKMVCPNPPHATAACVNSNCGFGGCNQNYADCNHDPKDGCESFILYDNKNCGACGQPCPMDNPFCDNGKCVMDQPNKIVFITSQVYDGNLGGLEGADAKCQMLAQAAGLKGAFMAWLSDGKDSPNTRMSKANVPYVLADQTIVAMNWAGFISGTLKHAIDMTEKGVSGVVKGNVGCPDPTIWSNTSAMGAMAGGSNCNFWTSNGNVSSNWGKQGVTDASWSSWCSGGICSWTDPFVCIQQ